MKNGVKEGEWKTSINESTLRTNKFARGFQMEEKQEK
jgi:hypothetical protein